MLQPVTPDLGDKGLVCWCAGRAGPDVRNGRAGQGDIMLILPAAYRLMLLCLPLCVQPSRVVCCFFDFAVLPP